MYRYFIIFGLISFLTSCGVKQELRLPNKQKETSEQTTPLPTSTSTTIESK